MVRPHKWRTQADRRRTLPQLRLARGARKPIAGGPFPNSGSREFTPPKQNHARESDWVLLLKAADSR
ncbi:hypothetical protein SBA5_110015 [Candidatus Sulfotelmatomonas gaucii]|uniref:Uncharacterized protein n=1 Tax=Candidatus Sulfuritelmatomonas gaucii TaxID=2043161 RepID=A0A2N9L3V6_9BACT|nr:hypothetical protein SBA5_110015 [Candidatus Sulfotelmatomonas gaucii]